MNRKGNISKTAYRLTYTYTYLLIFSTTSAEERSQAKVWTKGGTKTPPNSASIAPMQPTSVPSGRLGGFAGRLFQFGPRRKLQKRLLVRSTLSLARRCSECGTVG
jgi:hypothetical protein